MCISLSDPSMIIGYHCHSLTNCRLVNLFDVTLAYKDANSKLIDIVTVADVDDEDRVGNKPAIFAYLKLRFGLDFCSDFEHKVWSTF